MKTASKIAIAAVAVVAVGTAATFSLTAPSQADSRGGWGGPGHHGMMMRGHGMGMARTMMVDRLFNVADADGDGTITREEFDQAIADRIAEYDTNGDGVLDIEEFEGLYLEITRPAMVRAFQFLDAEGAGTIGTEQIERPANRLFDRLSRGEDEISRDAMERGPRGYGRHSEWRGRGEGRRGEWRERAREHREMRREMLRQESGEVTPQGEENGEADAN